MGLPSKIYTWAVNKLFSSMKEWGQREYYEVWKCYPGIGLPESFWGIYKYRAFIEITSELVEGGKAVVEFAMKDPDISKTIGHNHLTLSLMLDPISGKRIFKRFTLKMRNIPTHAENSPFHDVQMQICYEYSLMNHSRDMKTITPDQITLRFQPAE